MTAWHRIAWLLVLVVALLPCWTSVVGSPSSDDEKPEARRCEQMLLAVSQAVERLGGEQEKLDHVLYLAHRLATFHGRLQKQSNEAARLLLLEAFEKKVQELVITYRSESLPEEEIPVIAQALTRAIVALSEEMDLTPHPQEELAPDPALQEAQRARERDELLKRIWERWNAMLPLLGSFHNRHYRATGVTPTFTQSTKLELLDDKAKTAGPVNSSPAWGPDGLLAVGSGDHHLHLFRYDAKTGKLQLLDKAETGGWVRSSPAWGPDGLLAVGSADRHLHLFRYDAKTGKLQLLDKAETGGWVHSSPAWGPDGLLAVGSDDGHLHLFRFDAKSGKLQLLAKAKTGGLVHSSPAWGPDGLLAVGSQDRHLHLFRYDAKTGKLQPLDKAKTGGWVYSSPAWGPDGLLAMGSQDHHLHLFRYDATSGKLQRLDKAETGGWVESSPAWGPDGLLAVGSGDHHLHLFRYDAKTGKLQPLDKAKTGDWVYSSPAWGPDGLLAVGSNDHHLHLFRFEPKTGWTQHLRRLFRLAPATGILRRLGKAETGGWVASSPAWGPDGLLAVGSTDGHVYLLQVRDSMPSAQIRATGAKP